MIAEAEHPRGLLAGLDELRGATAKRIARTPKHVVLRVPVSARTLTPL
jgi:hypothetical protein